MNQVEIELVKAGLSASVSVFTLALGWLLGQRLTHYWSIRQKQREIELSIVNDIYKLYGEFFAIWKLWNYSLNNAQDRDFAKSTKWELLKRAGGAEAGMEAVFVRLASEIKLQKNDIEGIGKFRQAYQQLRKRIKENKALDWNYSEHPEYLVFKNGATKLVRMLHASSRKYNALEKKVLFHDFSDMPTSEEAVKQLRRITSNEWENQWAKQ